MSTDFERLHNEADAAGKAAAEACRPTPMVVTQGERHWFINDGVCGFAWVRFAGNTAWARWAKKRGLAGKSYPSGCSIWVSDYNQSMQLKESYARSYAQVLRNHGIEAYVGSRMD